MITLLLWVIVIILLLLLVKKYKLWPMIWCVVLIGLVADTSKPDPFWELIKRIFFN